MTEKVALITGANRGIGAAVAVKLAGRGFRVMLAVRNPESAAEVLAAIPGARVVRCDVARMADAEDAVAATVAAFGRLDVLVNNAGVIEPIGHAADVAPQAWEDAIRINLVGPFNLVHAAMPRLLKSRGAIINVGTGAAHNFREGWSAYCSSKAGLSMFTRAVAEEYGERGIRSICAQPGVVDTGMQGAIRASGMNPVSRLRREDLQPPDRPGAAIAWLCESAPMHLNGRDLKLDEILQEMAKVS